MDWSSDLVVRRGDGARGGGATRPRGTVRPAGGGGRSLRGGGGGNGRGTSPQFYSSRRSFMQPRCTSCCMHSLQSLSSAQLSSAELTPRVSSEKAPPKVSTNPFTALDSRLVSKVCFQNGRVSLQFTSSGRRLTLRGGGEEQPRQHDGGSGGGPLSTCHSFVRVFARFQVMGLTCILPQVRFTVVYKCCVRRSDVRRRGEMRL